MKPKILNLLLILTSLFGYLEWGGNHHLFLFQAEAEVFLKLLQNPQEVLHPFTVLPLAGQLILLATLFQKKVSKILTFISIGAIGLLLVFMLIAGVMSANLKIILSTIPFIVIALLTIVYRQKMPLSGNRST